MEGGLLTVLFRRLQTLWFYLWSGEHYCSIFWFEMMMRWDAR